MGILSELGNSVASAVDNRGLFGSINKEFKRFADTDVGKAVILGAAIYFGGGVAGWWETPFSSVAGAASAGSEATGAASLGGGIDAAAISPEAVLAPAETAATTATASTAAPAVTGAPLGSGITAGAVTESGSALGAGIAPSGSALTAPPAAGNWFTRLPDLAQYGLIQSGLGAVQGAMTPNAIDMAQEQARLAQEAESRRIEERRRNLNMSGIRLDMTPRPQGIINGMMGGA